MTIKWHSVSASITGEEHSSNKDAGGSFTERRRTRWNSASRTITCTSKQTHMSHEQELQTIKEKSDFTIWVSWWKWLKKVLMCLCDDVETVSDCCPLPEFHIRDAAPQPVFQALTHFREQRKLFLYVECTSFYNSFLFFTAENLLSAVSGNDKL